MNRILEILQGIRPEFDFEASDNYIEDGMLDSFDVISLVTELEQAFGITIDGLDILPENFAGLDCIEALVVKSGGTL